MISERKRKKVSIAVHVDSEVEVSSSHSKFRSVHLDDDQDSSSDHHEDIVAFPKPKRRRKSSYIPVSPFKAIIKRDIRRFIPAMFVNVINSFDADLLSAFLTTYSLGDHLQVVDHIPELHTSSPIRFLVGASHFASLASYEYSQFPDLTMQCSDAVIKRRLNEDGSKICIRVNMCGTKLFQAHSNRPSIDNFITASTWLPFVDPSNFDSVVALLELLQLSADPEMKNALTQSDFTFVPLKVISPMPFEFSLDITFYLDGSNRITRLESKVYTIKTEFSISDQSLAPYTYDSSHVESQRQNMFPIPATFHFDKVHPEYQSSVAPMMVNMEYCTSDPHMYPIEMSPSIPYTNQAVAPTSFHVPVMPHESYI